MTGSISQDPAYNTALAIIGMSGRFPGAQNIDAFWRNIVGGVGSIRQFSDEELLAAGVDPALLQNPSYVKAGAPVDGVDNFDASFFGYTPREAEVMDPQHRLFLECCWEALEDAAYDVHTYRGLIGTFAGSAVSTYMLRNLFPNQELVELVGQLQLDVGNDRDSLASTVAYKLNLKGPAVAVQTFCSTSLVAVHMACQSLLNYESDIALAGGVAIITPQESGYLYEEGGILSPDGVCHTFDARGQGSVMGNGVATVAIKRLSEALEDGDHIYAVIRGSAINNDGSTRVSYTAPGVDGQANVIAGALSYAGVHPESISYIEAHGTATVLGDAVELMAMMKAFRAKTQKQRFCAIGSVKPNIGHLDRAAGVAGLIKTALALQHQQIPPSLNFEHSSPDIDLHNSPFYVNTQLQEWVANGTPRRAGVSSFGLGGTNAHVVLEEAPTRTAGAHSGRPWHLLILSARTEKALQAITTNLYEHLCTHPELNMSDVAHTLQVGRSAFNYRRIALCQDYQGALRILSSPASPSVYSDYQVRRDRPVVFLLPAESFYTLEAIQELYRQEPAFQESVEQCCTLLRTQLGLELQPFFVTERSRPDTPELAQPVLFIIEYALAQLLQHWGIRPTALLGHDLGEFVAACLSGALNLEDALMLVARRAQILASLPQTEAYEAISRLAREVRLRPPTIPYISNVTATWITPEQATNPSYWARSLEGDIAQSIGQVLQERGRLLLEVGPGQLLSDIVRQHQACDQEQTSLILSCMTAHGEQESSQAHLLTTLGRMWLAGVTIEWNNFSSQKHLSRLSLPTYPFERKRYWVEAPGAQASSGPIAQPLATRKADVSDWFYVPTWQLAPLPTTSLRVENGPYLIFLDHTGIGEATAARLERAGARVIRVSAGDHFAQDPQEHFSIHPQQPEDYRRLCRTLEETGHLPHTIVHCWSLSWQQGQTEPASFATHQDRGFYSLILLVQALGEFLYDREVQLLVASTDLQQVSGQEPILAEKATLLGACTVIGQENLNILCRSVDFASTEPAEHLVAGLWAESGAASTDRIVGYREGKRWIRAYAARKIAPVSMEKSPFRRQGIYLITGGLGGIGLALAEHLAHTVQARLVLLGRSALPARETWAQVLAASEVDTHIRRKIEQIQHLEALGAEVLVLQTDVADLEQMQHVLEQTLARFGTLHGVFHAAGNLDLWGFKPIQDIGREECEAHFQAKVYGTRVMEQVLGNQELDFCLLFSSISTVLGGLGLVGYAAANAFMDAFVARHNLHATTPWTTVDWDTWRVKDNEQEGALGSTVAVYSMAPSEAIQALEGALISGEHHLINSTGALDTRVRQWVLMEALHPQGEPEKKSAPTRQDAVSLTVAGDYERQLVALWQQILGIEQIGLQDNFFDLGGNSLIALQLIAKMKKVFRRQLSVVTLFEAPTIRTMLDVLVPADLIGKEEQPDVLKQRRRQARTTAGHQEIAIIGMAGRFPGAATVEQYWHNLCHGVESITFFSEEELIAAGVDPVLVRDPAFVKARPILDDVEHFDAAFFGYSPREAELMDPQHRLFMESCWEVLERAGYDPARYKGLIGVFGGANVSTYFHNALAVRPGLIEEVGGYQIAISTDKDSLTTGVSYKLNLKGASVAVQTFCSTSLVAVHLAIQSLAQGECDMALAGGVSVQVPVKGGHLYEEGGMESPDGHCRTFDARAKGSMFGDGVGVVVLKRLEDALQDGDSIAAVIKGSAINNDGSLKVSYTAPSVAGQAEVVMAALEKADVSAESISYVEAHGTATELGDPIEVASLTKAFRSQTERTTYCALGSVKTNVGHLDRAAGVSGLIKTALSLKHQQIPPSLHFETPNPQIDFASSPFYVNTLLRNWQAGSTPRRAGLNSLGMGGTNVHVILEEAPEVAASPVAKGPQLILLSARTATALETATNNLRDYVQQQAEQGESLNLADLAYTLQVGRKVFEQRRMLVCEDLPGLMTALETRPATQVFSHVETRTERPVVFLFPGVGEQYVGLAQELYERESYFREIVDRCAGLLQPLLGLDIRKELYREETTTRQTSRKPDMRALLGRNGSSTNDQMGQLARTEIAQPVVFVIEYALARLLMHWGIVPQAMLGYSLGEYVAACLAGTLSLDDALVLIARRAQWIAQQEQGIMLAVGLSAQEVEPYLDQQIDLAVINGPRACVLAGPIATMEQLEERLQQQEIVTRRVESTHAFHSRMLLGVQEQVTDLMRGLRVHAPQIPYLSNVTGTWITTEQATDPTYWAQHMCQTVQFAAGVGQILQEPECLILEVGPGQGLNAFVKQHPACSRERMGLVQSTLPARHERSSSQTMLLTTLGKLWLTGVAIDWERVVGGERRRRIQLPTYPFERKRYWMLPDGMKPLARSVSNGQSDGLLNKAPDLADWFYLPSWKQSLPHIPSLRGDDTSVCWLLFVDTCGIGEHLREWLQRYRQNVIIVTPGDAFICQREGVYSITPTVRADYEALLRDLHKQGKQPQKIVYLWTITARQPDVAQAMSTIPDFRSDFYCLLAMIQAIGDQGIETCEIFIISNGLYSVTGSEILAPEKSTILGPCRVIPQEYPGITCCNIDIVLPEQKTLPADELIESLLGELLSNRSDAVVALRGNRRWIQSFERVHLPQGDVDSSRLRQGGVYLITGGLGGIGLGMAEYLARTVQARLVLVGRSGLPPRNEWEEVLALRDEDDMLARRIRQVMHLEELGSEVLLEVADVADEIQMQEVVARASARFGTLHGVLHAAGLPGVGLMQLKTPEMVASIMYPKVQGTLVLDRVLRDVRLDFLVLFSSVTSTTGGGPGQIDYCAANAFLDAYAQSHFTQHGRTVSIAWNEWQWNAWLAGLDGYDPALQNFFIENRRRIGISFEEGAEALQRILSCRLSQVVVSPQDFTALIEASKDFTTETVLQQTREGRQSQSMYERPTLGVAYVAPSTELEEAVAEIWSELLGIEQIGMNDNFFELGGHSLLGTQLISRLRRKFQINLPLVTIFEAFTITDLAAVIELTLIEEIERLGEEEIEHTLSERDSISSR